MARSPNRLVPRIGRHTLQWLLAAASVLGIIALYYTQNAFVEGFEDRTYDLRFKSLRGAIPPNPDIAVIAIDDKSIAELGRFPWSRSQYVRLLQHTAGARAVLFDELFMEPEAAGTDRALAAAIRKAGNVVLATAFKLGPDLQVTGASSVLPVFGNAAAGIGHINFLPEDDGVNRRNLLLAEYGGATTPSLGLAGAMAALGEKTFTVAQLGVGLAGQTIPTDSNHAMWINYTGKEGTYPRYSFADVAAGRVAPGLLKGKVLFLGTTALGAYDMRVTPYSGNVPGVEVHAAVADDIISGRFIHRSGIESLFDITLIVLLGSLAFALTMRMRLYSAIPATLLLAAAYVWLSYWLFLQGHWVSMIYPPLAAAAALLTGGGFRYLVLERNAREMRSMFSAYVSSKVVAQLEKDPDAARIGGDIREVTVLFTDIKSFTSFSETHSAPEVVSRLNEYLAAMVHVIHQFDGTVDKFMGDGIMAFWGAPVAQPDHARLAVACTLAMQKTMAALTEKWSREGAEPFSIRGGLQSGEVVAGNIGSHGKKMDYTVIGDTVNQASRLEGTAKYYNVSFLVGESTYLLTRDACHYRELDRIRVVGKQVPVAVYELRGLAPDTADTLAERFEAALVQYRSRQWDAAAKGFAAILDDFPADTPSAIYLERCRQFRETPPAADWDGVFDRLDK